MNIRHLDMVESLRRNIPLQKSLFLRFGRNIPPKKHHALGRYIGPLGL